MKSASIETGTSMNMRLLLMALGSGVLSKSTLDSAILNIRPLTYLVLLYAILVACEYIVWQLDIMIFSKNATANYTK